MPSLSQSPFLQALGYAIANSLWQMALVWIVFVLLNSVLKFKSDIKYKTAVAAQITGFAWFIVTLQFYYRQCSEALRMAKAMSLQNGGESIVLTPANDSVRSYMLSFFVKTEQVLPYLSIAYLALLVLLTVRWFRAYRYTQLVRLNGLHKIDVDWKLFVNRIAAQLGIKAKVRIYLSELVKSPVTIGFIKPVILIPIASITHLTPQQLEAVILHELAHIRRHDYLLNIVLSIIELGLFFNPFTRLINKSISKERENSCDDWVLQYQYSPAMYAEALLRIAVLQKQPAMAMYAVKSKGELVARVQRMIHQKDSRFSYRHQLLALLLMTGILTSLAWFDPNQMKTSNDVAEVKPSELPYVVEPMAAKVDNPFFNPISFFNEPLKEEVKETIKESSKQIAKAKGEVQLAMRNIELPKIAPVTIDNLEQIEKSLSHVEKDMKKSWFVANGKAFNGDMQFKNVFFTDSLIKGNNFQFNFAPFESQEWQAKTIEELKKAEMSIAKALRSKQITALKAKGLQDDINKAMAELKTYSLTNAFTYLDATTTPGIYYFRDEAEDEGESSKAKTDKKRTRTSLHAAPTAHGLFRQRREADADEAEAEARSTASTRRTSGTALRAARLKADSVQVLRIKDGKALLTNEALVSYYNPGTIKQRTPVVVTEGEYSLTIPQGTRVVPMPCHQIQAQSYAYAYGVNGSQNSTTTKEHNCNTAQHQQQCKEKPQKKSDCSSEKIEQKVRTVIVNGKTYKVTVPEIKGEQVILDFQNGQ